jgi:hypothetical protein
MTVVEAGGEGGGLSKVATQFHYDYAAINGRDLLQERKRMVATTVVNEYQLEGLMRGLHDDLQAVVKLGYVLLFVVKRNDD